MTVKAKGRFVRGDMVVTALGDMPPAIDGTMLFPELPCYLPPTELLRQPRLRPGQVGLILGVEGRAHDDAALVIGPGGVGWCWANLIVRVVPGVSGSGP